MNKIYLLDTNIISEFTKKEPNENVLNFFEARKNLCALSAVTFQELVYGLSKMAEGKKKNTLSEFIEDLRINMQILPYDAFASEICGKALGTFEKKGKTLPYSDTQIAATAISNGMVLVTHNTADFQDLADQTFLKMEDWFTA